MMEHLLTVADGTKILTDCMSKGLNAKSVLKHKYHK